MWHIYNLENVWLLLDRIDKNIQKFSEVQEGNKRIKGTEVNWKILNKLIRGMTGLCLEHALCLEGVWGEADTDLRTVNQRDVNITLLEPNPRAKSPSPSLPTNTRPLTSTSSQLYQTDYRANGLFQQWVLKRWKPHIPISTPSQYFHYLTVRKWK